MPSINKFLAEAASVINAGVARALFFTGNISDLFSLQGKDYVPLVDLLRSSWSNLAGRILVVYGPNQPIQFIDFSVDKMQVDARELVKNAWEKWRSELSEDDEAIRRVVSPSSEKKISSFNQRLEQAQLNPTLALEFLRQLCIMSRSTRNSEPLLKEDLIIVVDRADLIVPQGEIARLSEADRHRISILYSWFTDSGFNSSNDSVVLTAESKSQVNAEISKLPQITEVKIPFPDEEERKQFIRWFMAKQPEGKKPALWGTVEELALSTAALPIQALRDLLLEAAYKNEQLTIEKVLDAVGEYIKWLLGGDETAMVEVKKPTHRIVDLVGLKQIKPFLCELVRRIKSSDSKLTGVTVVGPNGSGKSFDVEAVASESGILVLVLGNIRSMWFGETDVRIERLRRVLLALGKVLIIIDEADTQLGDVSTESHSTEKRLSGKILAMMSDSELKGKVFWFLITARPEKLPPDYIRVGRAGDFIFGIFDPDDEERKEFLLWALQPAFDQIDEGITYSPGFKNLEEVVKGWYASMFSYLRTELKRCRSEKNRVLTLQEIFDIVSDIIPSSIEKERRLQTLQGLLLISRKSLLPKGYPPENREKWQAEIRKLKLELVGVY